MHALRRLQRMGRPPDLALRILEDPAMDEPDCARALVAMEILPVYLFPLTFTTFDSERFLLRVPGREPKWRTRVAAILTCVREERTLLRPAGPAGETLLRAATNSARARPGRLLRAANQPPPDTSPPASPWWKRILGRLFRRAP